MATLVVIVICSVICAALAMALKVRLAKPPGDKRALRAGFETSPGRVLSYPTQFRASRRLIGIRGGVAIDERSGCFKVWSGLVAAAGEFNGEDFVRADVLQNGSPITQSDHARRTMMGIVLLGRIGLLASDLSGKRQIATMVSQIDLQVTVRNMEHPSFTICLHRGDKPSSGRACRRAMQQAFEWTGRLESMKQIASIVRSFDTSTEKDSAGELTPLASLFKEGVLSGDELIRQ